MTTEKIQLRKQLREMLAALPAEARHARSVAACNLLMASPEFTAARVVMLFVSMPAELETASIALRCWQEGKTVVAPQVNWEQRHMLPVEITSLTSGIRQTGPGVPEPESGKPIPVSLIDLVIVPGLGFTADGHRIGRGMGFYDRFLAQPEFIGLSCGLGFECQVVAALPLLDHDVRLDMLVTDREIRRFSSNPIPSRRPTACPCP